MPYNQPLMMLFSSFFSLKKRKKVINVARNISKLLGSILPVGTPGEENLPLEQPVKVILALFKIGFCFLIKT